MEPIFIKHRQAAKGKIKGERERLRKPPSQGKDENGGIVGPEGNSDDWRYVQKLEAEKTKFQV